MTRLRLAVAILLVLAGCRDAAAPFDGPNVLGDRVSLATSSEDTRILRQSPAAPPLETYQVSFWASNDRASMVAVNYQSAAGQSVGRPFLRFELPQGALRAGPGGRHLGRRDSVFITLTIDPNDFSIEFQPSGLVFSRRHPATLAIWFGNADPDVNGDGVVDGTDQTLAAQLAIWGRHAHRARWRESSSHNETGQQWVWAALRHFSEYAVCW